MSRKKRANRRVILADSRFNSPVVSKFINLLMRKGKKSIAEKIFYSAVEKASKKIKEEPLRIFTQVIDNVRPSVEVCARRFGGATYQVPREVSDTRSISLAMRWIIRSTNKRTASLGADRLCSEICDAFNNKGLAIKMRDEVHKLAAANKAFSHFKW